MDWDLLRVFLAVARSGRVSAAARTLRVEHTTVSRRLAALEEQLGVTLFYRTAAGYRLTPNGARVVTQAEAMEELALELDARARDEESAASGRVRIALLDEFASHWLAPRLGELRRLHPRIDPELVIGLHPLDLTRGEADLAVRGLEPRQAGLTAARFARVASGLYASTALARKQRLRVTDRASLRDLPLLVYSEEYQRLQAAIWFAPILENAPIALRTNSTHALLAAARAQVGVAVLPRFVAARYEDLVAVSPDTAAHQMWLVTHTAYRKDPRIRAVLTFLRDHASALEV